MIAHLPRCLATLPGGRYACNCGADAQTELAAKLDQAEVARQKADAIDRRWGVDPEAERRLDAMLRETRPSPTPPVATPLRAVARMLRRLRDRATHHDAARHLLATAGDAVELAAGLAPEEAVRVLDAVEPPAGDDANAHTH